MTDDVDKKRKWWASTTDDPYLDKIGRFYFSIAFIGFFFAFLFLAVGVITNDKLFGILFVVCFLLCAILPLMILMAKESLHERELKRRRGFKVKELRNILLDICIPIIFFLSVCPLIAGYSAAGVLGAAIGFVHTVIAVIGYYMVYKRRLSYLIYALVFLITFFGTVYLATII